MTLHDIHCLDEGGANEGKDERQVRKVSSNSPDEGRGGDKEYDPVNACIFLLLFHLKKFVQIYMK